MGKIKVIANGNEVEIEENSTIQEFVEERKISGTMFVIEKNQKVVPKHEYTIERLANGDKIEIAGFFGGG